MKISWLTATLVASSIQASPNFQALLDKINNQALNGQIPGLKVDLSKFSRRSPTPPPNVALNSWYFTPDLTQLKTPELRNLIEYELNKNKRPGYNLNKRASSNPDDWYAMLQAYKNQQNKSWAKRTLSYDNYPDELDFNSYGLMNSDLNDPFNLMSRRSDSSVYMYKRGPSASKGKSSRAPRKMMLRSKYRVDPHVNGLVGFSMPYGVFRKRHWEPDMYEDEESTDSALAVPAGL